MDIEKRLAICDLLDRNKHQCRLSIEDVRKLDSFLRAKWKIVFPGSKSVMEQLEAVTNARTLAAYEEINLKRAQYLWMLKTRIPDELNDAWYDFIARDDIAGIIHSSKRPFILDTAAFLGACIQRMQIKGPVLDIGCNIGYHAIWLNKHFGNRVHGVDRSKRSIEMAQRYAKKLESTATFSIGTPDVIDDTNLYEMTYASDSMGFGEEFLSIASRLTQIGGIAIYIGKLPTIDEEILRRHGFCYGMSDVVGGWVGPEDGFVAEYATLLVRGGNAAIPLDRESRANSGWSTLFYPYTNSKGIQRAEMTQAYCRAKLTISP